MSATTTDKEQWTPEELKVIEKFLAKSELTELLELISQKTGWMLALEDHEDEDALERGVIVGEAEWIIEVLDEKTEEDFSLYIPPHLAGFDDGDDTDD